MGIRSPRPAPGGSNTARRAATSNDEAGSSPCGAPAEECSNRPAALTRIPLTCLSGGPEGGVEIQEHALLPARKIKSGGAPQTRRHWPILVRSHPLPEAKI